MVSEQPGDSTGEHALEIEWPGPEPDATQLRERMASELPVPMLEHTDRVVRVARELATLHGLSVARVTLAAQGHDLVRAVEPSELLRRAEGRSMLILPIEYEHPVLLHGPIGALELAERFAVSDPEILAAIYWHTTGHPRYPHWAWAMFIADKIEPMKTTAWPALERVAAIARRPHSSSLRDAATTYLRLSLARQRDHSETLHPLAEETLEHLESVSSL